MNNKSDSFEHSELISAYLDGEVTAADRAFVENNPELLMEVEKLKELHEITSFPIPVDPILLEKHITTALSSFTKDGEIIQRCNLAK